MIRILVTALIATLAGYAQTFTTIANFTDANAVPLWLIQGADGNLYGISNGNLGTQGSMFKVTLSGAVSTIYTAPGFEPDSIVQGTDGNFYGTAFGTAFGIDDGACQGAQGSCGTIFEITPEGQLTLLHNFSGADGANPVGLTLGTDGNFYGVTRFGGANSSQASYGTIFKITPAGMLTTSHSFQGTDGSQPGAALLQASDGNLYGTTQYGGTGNCSGVFLVENRGCGTIFLISPGGTFVSLHSFQITDGAYPLDTLVEMPGGTFYGTTDSGGAGGCVDNSGQTGCGTIFTTTAQGTVTTLDPFELSQAEDLSDLTLGSDGNFYGVSAYGGGSGDCGVQGGPFGCGFIFKLMPTGSFTPIYSFDTPFDVSEVDYLIAAADGNLYGWSTHDGQNLDGTVFKLTIPPPDTPAISATGGVVNGASFQLGISPGSWMTINGTNLSLKTDTWSNAIVNGALPKSLDGVSVMVGDEPAYIEYVSGTQINALVPNVAAGSVPVTVTTAIGTSQAVMADVAAVSPAFFQWGTYAVATRQNFSLAVKNGTFPGATTVPAKPGAVIILWGTGFGPTSPSAPPGVETPSTTTYNTATAVSVTVGKKPATVYGAALAPGYAGLYQVAIQIPALANGDYPVVATINGAQSPSTTMITVQQ
jgi:uncharacterized protein (TIGR03437 family)